MWTCLMLTFLHFVFMKWFVAMQIVGGKMDDSSKRRKWGKKCELSNNFFIFLHGLFVDCMDSLNHFFPHLEKCVCVCFFSHLEKCFDWSSFQNNYDFGPFRLFVFQYFSPHEIILQQKGQEGTGFSGPNSNEQKHPHKFIFFLYFSSCKMPR